MTDAAGAPAPDTSQPDIVPDQFKALEGLPQAELERRIQDFRSRPPRSLTDDELRECVAIHRIAVRKTSGPPKPKTRSSSTPMTLASIKIAGAKPLGTT